MYSNLIFISFWVLFHVYGTSGTESAAPWSQRMIESIILRQQGAITSSASTGTIASGILALALSSAAEQYPDKSSSYLSYRERVIDMACTGLLNATRNAELPLDRFSIASAILTNPYSSNTSESTAQSKALETLDDSFSLQRRNYLGGLWYYAAYPEWSYLDGMFSVLPYLALQPTPNTTEMEMQISFLQSHCFDADSGLVVHGYDASRSAVWANRVSGASPYVWGRSLGWYMSGLIQSYEILCQLHDDMIEAGDLCDYVKSLFSSLVYPLLGYVDEQTGVWFQMTTYPNRPGNWLESSSTALFVFVILKAQRIGMLPADSYVNDIALRAFEFTVSSGVFVQDYGNGTLGFNGTVAVCSLNSTASYEYYTGRPIEENSLIGESAFALAALEVEKLDELSENERKAFQRF